MDFPFDIKKLNSTVNAQLMKDFTGERTGFVEVGKDKWILPAKYEHYAHHYYNLPLRKDDLWILTYPRSGTTWAQELLWLIGNDLDYEKALNTPLVERFPFIEFNVLVSDQFKEDVIALNEGSEECAAFMNAFTRPGYKLAADWKSPRYIKSHLPLSLLPPALLDTCKVVYVARNPKDVAVSYYHHNRLIRAHGFEGDFSTYWDYFERDLLVYSPYWKHITEGWNQREHPNLLFLFYEDLSKDIKGGIRRVAEFFGKQLTEDQINKLANHLHIDNFRNNPSVKATSAFRGVLREGEEPFIRTGQVGGKTNYYTEELNARAEKWIKKNLENTDLRFPL